MVIRQYVTLTVLTEANGKSFEKHALKCALKTAKLVAKNGVFVAESLDQVAAYINGFQNTPQFSK